VTDWLNDWLIDWLIDWLFDWLRLFFAVGRKFCKFSNKICTNQTKKTTRKLKQIENQNQNKRKYPLLKSRWCHHKSQVWNTNLSYLATGSVNGAAMRPYLVDGREHERTSWSHVSPGHEVTCYRATGRRSSDEDWVCWIWYDYHASVP